MAIPAFQKVRTASQEKAVLNNLRQLGAGAIAYAGDHDGELPFGPQAAAFGMGA